MATGARPLPSWRGNPRDVARIAVGACCAGVLAAIGIVVARGLPSEAASWLLWVTALAAVVTVCASERLARTAVSPVIIVAGLAGVYGLVVPQWLRARHTTTLLAVDYSASFPTASQLTAIAVLGFCAGYLLARGRHPEPARGGGRLAALADRPGPTRTAWALAWLAVGLLVYRLIVFGPGGWAIKLGEDRALAQGVTAYVTYAPQYLFGFALYFAHAGRRRFSRGVARVVLGAVIFYFFASGVRYLVIVAVAAIFLLWWFRRHRDPLPPARYLVAGAVVGVLVVGLVGTLRGREQFGSGRGVRESAESSFDVFLPLAGLVHYTEDNGFLSGSSYTYIALQPIPRSLWPAKPYPPTYVATGKFTDIHEGRAFPLWGEMYLNFGVPGILVGMAAFGFLARWFVGVWLSRRAREPVLDVAAAIAIPLLVQWTSRGLLVQLLYNTAGLLGAPLVLVLIERRRLRARSLSEETTPKPLAVVPA